MVPFFIASVKNDSYSVSPVLLLWGCALSNIPEGDFGGYAVFQAVQIHGCMRFIGLKDIAKLQPIK
ncbi:hypothetical protein N482_09875 [Pseudoalteromonas luteoviolacea NCIMB 1942]|uniref:Uncharacterized protein n=1 Tax=Pseudoalteromonas luteoviolacea NCIMB 1942 TaxID=1365253 RepID=A0A167C8P5_9GAMM|nr:hypothetical protein N482_09875 [Pseudoalteromonas luteoviolacea NCIMB 1942]